MYSFFYSNFEIEQQQEIVVNENDGPIVTPQQPSGTLTTTSQRGYSGLSSATKSILANLQISNTIRLKVVTHCLTPTSSPLSDRKKTPFPVLVHNLVSETKDPTMIRWVSDGEAFVVNPSHPDLSIALVRHFSREFLLFTAKIIIMISMNRILTYPIFIGRFQAFFVPPSIEHVRLEKVSYGPVCRSIFQSKLSSGQTV